MSPFETHNRELVRLLAFSACFGALAVASYFVPGTEGVRPWIVGEPVPLVHLALGEREVVEATPGVLVSRPIVADLAESRLVEDTALPHSVLTDTDVPAPFVADIQDAPPPALAAVLPPQQDTPTVMAMGLSAVPTADPADGPLALVSVAPVTDMNGPPEGIAVHRRGAVYRPGEGALNNRTPAHGTPLEVPEGALDAYFSSLARTESGEPGHIARAIHFGDSTIAADGITKTVRKRLQGQYGDGGPGFLAVHVDRRWASRNDILRNPKGSWKTRTITFGGADLAYYGLAGTVSTANGPSTSLLGGKRGEDGRQPLTRFDAFFQVQPGGGTLSLSTETGEGVTLKTASESVGDAFHTIKATGGARNLTVSTGEDGPVTMYGVALETDGPGVTWETLGVAGAGSGSFFRQGANHIARQVNHRHPDLIVWQIGGNEVGLPVLTSGDGTRYKERYSKVIRKVLAGAPQASCLLVTPLDQGERYRGQVRSKPNLDRMVKLQREAAVEMGCAFWDARAAMGGSGAFGRWLEYDPPLAWTDLEHLSGRGLNLIGHSFADAIELAYQDWKRRNPALVSDVPALALAGEG